MNWLHYLLEANIYLAVFYAGYCLFLNKETHYTLNRVYLLLSCIISFILPLIQVGALKPADALAQQSYVTITPAASNVITSPLVNYKPVASHITLPDAVWYVYLTGIAVLSVLLIIKIVRLIKMTTNAKTLAGDSYKLVGLNDSNAAFSFFNYLFIGTKTAGSELIIQHELVHIRQKHSADILFIELLRIINWFNPIIYLLQVSVKTVHEYIADEQTANQGTDALTYSSFLVDNAYGLNGPSITHSFFNYNLLKKRIIMLNQKRSGNLARLKYLVAVPICGGLLCASTLAFSKNYALIDLAPGKLPVTDTVVESVSKPYVNAKGYTIEEKSFTVQGQPGFIVTITDKEGKKNIVDISKMGTPLGDSILNNVYGYQFPAVIKAKKIPVQIPPPPMLIKDSYNDLFYYLVKTVVYPSEAANAGKTGLVGISFNVKSDHKIDDIRVTKTTASVFDIEVLRVLKMYKGSVNETEGTHKIILYFANDYYKFVKTKEAVELKAKGYDLKLLVTENMDYSPIPKPNADKKATNIPQSPTEINDATKLPPPPSPAAPEPANATTSQSNVNEFYKYLGKHIRYPAIDRNNHIGGRVIASIDIVDGKITNPQITRGVEPVMDGEALRVVTAYDSTIDLKNGHYVIPMAFQLVDKKNNVVSHLPEPVSTSDQKIVGAKPDNQPSGFSTAVGLNEVVIVGYAN